MNPELIERWRDPSIKNQRFWMDGRWRKTDADGSLAVVSSIDAQGPHTMAFAEPVGMDGAVMSVCKNVASGVWSCVVSAERIKAHHAELVISNARDNGVAIGMAWKSEPESVADTFRSHAECVDKTHGEILLMLEGTQGFVRQANMESANDIEH